MIDYFTHDEIPESRRTDLCSTCNKWISVSLDDAEQTPHANVGSNMVNAMAHHKRVAHGIAIPFDHYAEACRLIDLGQMTEAQIHATLALVRLRQGWEA